MATIPDNFWVEWHPTRSVFAEVLDVEWVTLGGGIRELDCWRGYDRTTARIEAGEAVVVFDNRDRSLDPNNRQGLWWPNLGPLRHVRIRATDAGVSRTIWRGIITKTTPGWQGTDGWMTLVAHGTLMQAARELAKTVLDTAIAATNPELWLPLDDAGGTFVRNLGYRSSEVFQAYSVTGSDSILPYIDQPTTTFPYPGSSLIGSLGIPAYAPNPAGFSVMGIFKTDNPAAQVMLSIGPYPPAATAPSGDVALTVDAGGTYSLRVGNAGGSSLLQFPQPHNEVGTLVIGRWDPVNTSLEATIGLSTVGGNQVPNSGIGGSWTPRPGYIRVGSGLDTAVANPFLGQLAHICVWPRLLTLAEINSMERAFFGRAGYNLATGTKAQDQIAWVLDQLGVAASRRDLAVGTINLGAMHHDATAVELMSRAAATEGGYFHEDRDGKYVFRLRGARGAYRGTYDTAPPAGSGNRALVGLTHDVDDRTFYTVARMHVTQPPGEPTPVEYRHPNAAQFGDVVFEDPTQFATAPQASAAAVLLVGEGVPKTDIVEAVIQVGTDNVDTGALLDSEILDEADMIGRIPGGEATGAVMTWGSGPFWSFVVRDSVTRANSVVSAGSTEGGSGITGTAAWTPLSGTWGVDSGHIYKVSVNGGQDALVVDTGGADHEVEATLTLGAWYTGLVARAVDASNYLLLQHDPVGDLRVYALVGGGYTQLLLVPGPFTGTAKWGLRVAGSTVEVRRNDVLVASAPTGGVLATATKAGLYAYNAGTILWFDDIRVATYPATGWAGPEPYRQRSVILRVGHNYNGNEHVWRTRWAMSPS